ncbi:hypothetical protein ACNHUS_33045 [Actinomycetes bacterium M1A6_2h]
MSTWLNVSALWKVVVFGLVLGAGLPALFALGVRSSAMGTAGADGTTTSTSPAGKALAALAFGVVAIAVVLGVLFISRDFIGHHTGVYILGAVKK